MSFGAVRIDDEKSNYIRVTKFSSSVLDLTVPEGCKVTEDAWRSVRLGKSSEASVSYSGRVVATSKVSKKAVEQLVSFDEQPTKDTRRAPFKFVSPPALLPHQAAFKRIFEHRDKSKPFTQILFWRLGTGKTLGALSPFITRAEKPVVIVASNTLIHANWFAYIKSLPLKEGIATFTLMGYQEFNRRFCCVDEDGKCESLAGCTVIVDEIQRFRNASGNVKMETELEVLFEADELILLTGSPMMGSVDDLCTLLSLIQRRLVDELPSDLEKQFAPHVLFDCLSTESAVQQGLFSVPPDHETSKVRETAIGLLPWLPKVNLQTIEVSLSWRDTYLYMSDISQSVNKKLGIHRPTTNRYHVAEKQRINGPKMEATLKLLESLIERKEGPVLLASQFIKNGIEPFVQKAHTGWTKAVLDGATENVGRGKKNDSDTWTRRDIVEKIKKNQIDVLYMTSLTGGTGIDLKNVKFLICLDAQQTEEDFRQLQGRIARFKGLKEPNAVVEVYQVVARFPKAQPSAAELNEILKMHIELTRDDTWTAAELKDVLMDILKNDLKYKTVDEVLLKQNEDRQKPIDAMKSKMLSWKQCHYYNYVSAEKAAKRKKL